MSAFDIARNHIAAGLTAGALALLVAGTAAAATDPIPVAEDRPWVVIKTILGLIALMALAAFGSHPRVRQLEERLGIRQVITAGFAFVALGVIARSSVVGVLSDSVLNSLAPILRIGLGWIGFVLGFRFDAKAFDRLPAAAGWIVSMGTALPLLVITLATGLALFGGRLFTGEPFGDPVFVRDAFILGTAGAMTADTAVRGLFAAKDRPAALEVERLVQMEELAGVAGLAVLAAYFRPFDASWQLPGTAWLFLTLGLGTAVGAVAFAIVRMPATGAEAVVHLLGAVAFAAGIASYLQLSPVVVCFLAGAIVANLPGDYRRRVKSALMSLERPIYLLFLVIVGALWNWRDPTGWVLLVLFVPARFAGKWLGARFGSVDGELVLTTAQRRAMVLAPMGALPIAIVVNAQLLYPEGTVPALVTAVVGGAIVTEFFVQFATREATT